MKKKWKRIKNFQTASRYWQTPFCPLLTTASLWYNLSFPGPPLWGSHPSDKLPSNWVSTSFSSQWVCRSLKYYKKKTFRVLELNGLWHLFADHVLEIVVFLTSGPKKIRWLFSIVYDVVVALLDEVGFLRWGKVWFLVMVKGGLHPLRVVDACAAVIRLKGTLFSWASIHVTARQTHRAWSFSRAWFYPAQVRGFHWTCYTRDCTSEACHRTCACRWWAFFIGAFWLILGGSTCPKGLGDGVHVWSRNLFSVRRE